MGGGALAVEKAGRCQQEHARADGAQPGTPCVGRPQLIQDCLWRRFVRIAPAGNDDGVGLFQQFGRKGRGHRDAAGRPDRAWLDGADGEAVPCYPEFGPLEREQFDRAAEFEGTKPVVGQHNDEMLFHGAILQEIGICATYRLARPTR